MDHLSRKLIVASLLLLVLLPVGIASALTSVAHTNLTIHKKPSGDVAAGTAVSISGKLHSGAQVCRSGQPIELTRIGSGVVATTVTDAQGRYAFTAQTVNSDSGFRATFAGSVSGVHPNTRTCAGSSSQVSGVEVLGAGGGVQGTGGGNAVSGSGSAFTGADVLADLRLVAVLLISGLAALFVARRRVAVQLPRRNH
jgi:hypothetical protein